MSKKSLTEALKRYNQLIEYKFYVPNEAEEKAKDGEDLLLDEDETDPTADAAAGEETAESGPFGNPEAAEMQPGEEVAAEPTAEIPAPEAEAEPFGNAEMADPTPAPTPEANVATDGEVEVDVTDIVQNTQSTQQAVGDVLTKINDLLGKFSELESKQSAMDSVIQKIDSLESEVEKRMPTPDEKLSLRSLDSYPYNVKLTDFWSDQEGQYDVMNTNSGEPSELTLTQDDVVNDYSEMDIKNSFKESKEKKKKL